MKFMMNFFNHLNVGLVEFHIFGAWSPTQFCAVDEKKKKKKVLVSVVVLAFQMRDSCESGSSAIMTV